MNLSIKHIFLLVTILFFVVISVNFFKPFGFFRESNAALVCINAEIWNNNPTIKNEGIPVNSYFFNSFNNTNDQLYTSTITFGNAWIAVPYYFFQIFNITPNEISIRLFSVFWLIFTLGSIYLLLKKVEQLYKLNQWITPIVLILYLFAPATLWYNVQGYVHEVAVLPFYFLSWFTLLQYKTNQQLKWLCILMLLLIIAIQFDWLPCIQAAVISLYLLIQQKKLQHKWAFIAPVIAVIIALSIIIYIYGSWAGYDRYFEHMKSKFIGRAVGAKGLQLSGYLNHNLNFIVFYCISMGAVGLIALRALIKQFKCNTIIALMLATSFLHHAIFWGFTNEHDHSAIKSILPITFLAANFLVTLNKNKIAPSICIVLLLNIAQYFVLHNYPIRKGIYANSNYCKEIGENIKNLTNKNDDVVFVNTADKHYLQIEFYAKRFYVNAVDSRTAQQKFKEMSIGKQACLLYFNENKLVYVKRFTK